MIVLCSFIVFYIGAVYVSFLAYREFKAMLYDNGLGSMGGGIGNMMMGGSRS